MISANCPSCGAPVTFRHDGSVVVICDSCHSIVARGDRAVEDLGKVAALLASESPIHVGLETKYRGIDLRITGRVQLAHSAGGFWDEWYAAFEDGRWGWIAEAQGKVYLTFRKDEASTGRVPPVDVLSVGAPVPALELSYHLVVAEKGAARIRGAEGEIPWKPDVEETYWYADLAGESGRFGTLDFSEVPPLLFVGSEIGYEDLGLTGKAAAAQATVATSAVSCPNCGGRLELRAPDSTQRVTCPFCASLLDVNEGQLRYLRALEPMQALPLPLGSTGRIHGVDFTVIGYLQRSVTFDRKYYWDEYLLYNRDTGFRWLVDSDDHWSFVEPLSGGDVVASEKYLRASAPQFGGKPRNFRLYQDAVAIVEAVYGEFYWKVEIGEMVKTSDFVSPPYIISREVSSTESSEELNYSLGTWVSPKQIEKTFGVKKLRRPDTVAPNQPYPYTWIYRTWAVMLLAALVVALLMAMIVPKRTLFEKDIDFNVQSGNAPTNSWSSSEPSSVFFSEPFDIRGRRNVMIDVKAGVNNSWIYLDGDLFNTANGFDQAFGIPVEWYHGYEGGESWSEGKNRNRSYVGALPAGRYTLRLEAQWERGRQAPSAHVKVVEGVSRGMHFLLLLGAVSLFPAFIAIRHLKFEKRRWEDSDNAPFWATATED